MDDNFQFQQNLDQVDQLLKEGKPTAALRLLRESLKIAPDDPNVHFFLGIALQKCSRFHLAFQEFKWLSGRGSDTELKRQMGWTKVMMGELEEGRKYLREAINMDLLNSWAYADLGMSYAKSFEFDTALDWMERAKHLNPDDKYIQWNIEYTKNMRKEFNAFSEKDKKKIQELQKDPQEQKQMMVQSMFDILRKDNQVSPEDMEEVKKELELAGFNPQFESFKPPRTTKEKEIVEYMQYHHKVKDVERKISPKELKEIEQILFNKNSFLEKLKEVLLILAHQGTKEALALLKNYHTKPHPKLKGWVVLAIEECRLMTKQKPGKIIQIIH